MHVILIQMKFDSLPIDNHSVLLIVDMQYDFLPKGALPVPSGDEIIVPIANFAEYFAAKDGKIIFTQDWHPEGHLSFASAHPNSSPGDPIEAPGLGPILWPDHCIQDSHGAQIHDKLPLRLAVAILRKGYHPTIDSYSTFLENDHKTPTGLTGLLQNLNISKVFICGLALDYCCYYSAVDARNEGFDVYFLSFLSRGIDQPENNIEHALLSMKGKGIHIITDE